MKRNILFVIFLISIATTYGQVGISTLNVGNKILYVDPKNNNSSDTPTAQQAKDDFVIDAEGNVGVGVQNPTVKLHLKTDATKQIKFENDPTVADSLVLTSDANGVGYWHQYQSGSTNAVFDANGVNFNLNDPNVYNSGSYIDLKPGRWILFINLLITTTSTDTKANMRGTLRISFSESGATPSSDILSNNSDKSALGTVFLGTSTYAIDTNVTTRIIINNSSKATKRYYLLLGNAECSDTTKNAQFVNAGKSNNSSNITAFRVKNDN